MRFYEGHERSIVKAITYRLFIIISTAITTYIVTQSFSMTMTVTLTATIVNTLVYYLHERFWNRIHWGKNKA